MRIILILMMVAMISMQSFSQESDGQFLLKDSKVTLSSFYAEINPSTSFAILNGQMVNIMELTGGLILNNRFYFSYFMTGSSKVNTVAIPEPFSEDWVRWIDAGVELEKVSSGSENLFTKFKHTGLRFGYMHITEKPYFWRAGLMFGFSGGFNMTEDQTFLGMFDNKVWESKIMTLEPHIGGGVNLLPWWRLNVDLGYRLMKLDEKVLEATQTDGITFKLGFAFGNFKLK